MACHHIEAIKISIRSIQCKLDGLLQKVVSAKLGFSDASNVIDSLIIKMGPGEINKKENSTLYSWFSNDKLINNDYMDIENVVIIL